MPQVDAGAGFLVTALIIMAAAFALTAFRVDAALDRGDGEKLFWIGFTGLLAALLAVAWAVAGNPGAGPWIGLAAVAGAGGAAGWVQARHRRRVQDRLRNERARAVAALERRHETVLLSWSSYELDEWKAEEKPGLKDPARPETKSLMRAMKAAAALRPLEGAAEAPEAELDKYAAAVAGLEQAWAAAEAAGGDDRAA
ncbi:hypothetical protein [Arthrobacter sp. G119Y2]|uniref:hypothetical protein n=1 Tax=Arthrobacter sp. G119Y2 TaxID=3134965 RepID=UPI003119E82A